RYDIAAAIDGLRSFCRPTDSYSRYMHDAAFFLYRTAVCQYASGVLFQFDEVEKSEGFVKFDQWMQHELLGLKLFQFRLRPRVQAGDHPEPEGFSDEIEAPDYFGKGSESVNVFCTMYGDQHVLLVFQAQLIEDGALFDLFCVCLQYFIDWIARQDDPVNGDAFAEKVHFALGCI